jgi:multiphosphoryl transfer protein
MNANPKLQLFAPLSGQLVPLEQVPDKVFSQKMVGDGISIDPVTSVLLAPCNGTIIQMHSAGHALTIRSAEGIEVLIHIGLDTVSLKGNGFSPRVKLGDRVSTGDPLTEFDADFIATHAKSLLTEIVITTMDLTVAITPFSGSVIAGRDIILELTLAEAAAMAVAESVEAVPTSLVITSEEILIPNPNGLHARPAAVLVNLAKRFSATVRLKLGDKEANARSVVAIMMLEVGFGDRITLEAEGPDAGEAISKLTTAIKNGLGNEEGHIPSAPAEPEMAPPAPVFHTDDPDLLSGVSASTGLGVGSLHQFGHEEIVVVRTADDPLRERQQLEDAIAQARLHLESLLARLQGDPAKAAIFAAHLEMLDDPEIMEDATSAISHGTSAAYAWQQAYTVQVKRLAGLKNKLLAARANDLVDVGMRVLRLLTGSESRPVTFPPRTILAAEELTPSDIARLDGTQVVGFCTTTGGATSHVAILARSLGIPAVTGIDSRVLGVPDGTPVILNGDNGTLRLNPSPNEIAAITGVQEERIVRQNIDLARSLEPAVTRDGHRIEVVANITGLADVTRAITLGGEGVGLLRSEFLFMGRETAPDEEEQFAAYREIAAALGAERPLIIRTLDVGGDKHLPYLAIPREDNPFLGERGIRVGLARPEMLRTQLRAILRAAHYGKVQVMFPMIGLIGEWRAAKEMLEEERIRLGIPPIPVGIMVEIPSAALMAELFAREVDFFSIGSNDLAQYTLAIDRGHPTLAHLLDGLNPAVLRLVANTVSAARTYSRRVGVCGGMAGDPQAIPILIGLGVDELSVSIPAIPAVKAQIRTLSRQQCEQLARKALEQESGAGVRLLCPDGLTAESKEDSHV